MTPTVPFRAADASNCPTSAVLARLRVTGAPHIFASYNAAISPGFKFTLEDADGTLVLFEVVRMTDAKEFRERYPGDEFPSWVPDCYYEAEVRD